MWEIINDIRKKREKAVLAVIVETKGSTPRKAGSKLLVTEKGEIYGTVGGGDLEYFVVEKAKELLESQQPMLLTHNLKSDFKMACGGKVTVYLEPIVPPAQLFIFGAGHIGKELAGYAKDFDFEITVIDSRKDILDTLEGNGYKLICATADKAVEQLHFDDNTYICAISHTHDIDRQIASLVLNKPYAYLGVIASKNKAQKIRKALTEEGFDKEKTDSIDMPMGVPIECETPKEIAISVLAKLIDAKNRKIKAQKEKITQIKTYNAAES